MASIDLCIQIASDDQLRLPAMASIYER